MRPAIPLLFLAAGCGRVSFERVAPIDSRLEDAPADMQTPDSNLAAIGCSDGVREGFGELAAFPTIAGCSGPWFGSLGLRASRTGVACGNNSLVPCGAPVDACAPGWHVCGDTGDPTELSSRITALQCQTAIEGRFVAAMQHCLTATPCVYTAPLGCPAGGACSEPVCCGLTCQTVNNCKDAVFSGGTMIVSTGMYLPACGSVPSDAITGVLCCR